MIEPQPTTHPVWILKLIPEVKAGRWLYACLSSSTLLGLMYLVDVGEAHYDVSLPVVLFFCVALTYIVPIFHYISQRTEEALDELHGNLDLDPMLFASYRQGIRSKSKVWIAVNLGMALSAWLAQSIAMFGSLEDLFIALTYDARSFLLTILPMLIWLTTMAAIHALVDNARAFKKLAGEIDIDLLTLANLMPFGRMAVSSTLVVIGFQASMSIMWFGGEISIWATLPGMIPTTGAIVYLLIAPVWPLHKAIKLAKEQEIERVTLRLRSVRSQLGTEVDDIAQQLGPMLAYRREVIGLSEWPFNLSVLSRLGLYLFIVPLTWVGAALIENVVDVFIA